jgi:hypothetical protein
VEKFHSLKKDKAPIKKQRSKVNRMQKQEEKTAPKPERRRKSRTHIIQAANRLAAPAPLFSKYVLAIKRAIT